ncbi:MAG TPA: L-seryl-tRNA(Sec) selenium transferase [Candidatus Limnocylindrales bacterium]|jgi:L-seryl-tRNA(Ser) seleniumtransferase
MAAETSPHPPSIERVLAAAASRLVDRDHAAVVAAAREVVAEERLRLSSGDDATSVVALADKVVSRLEASAAPDLVPVVNATGVILHTNLGRAPWPEAAIRAAASAAQGASLLEMDRATGQRGARFRAAEAHLIALTGAEDALVTNNNAAAVALALAAAVAAPRRAGPSTRRGRSGGVAVGRGELVEIGGGVRIPDIIRRAGLRLVEVGTTNRTRIADYREALESGAAIVVLRVHPSNFRMEGFVEKADPSALAAMARELDAVVVDDLGSGALLDTAAFGLAHEPMPMERLASGADLVCFSGDKLVGGPQAGLLVGRSDLVARIRKDPLARAMRPDKVTLAALAATLGLYRAGLATTEIPVWRMIAAPEDALRGRAETLAGKVARLGHTPVVVPLEATIGGGSLPGETLPSWGLALPGTKPQKTLDRLRLGSPAVVARIEDDTVVLDLRTVESIWDETLPGAIARALGGQGAQPGPYQAPL